MRRILTLLAVLALALAVVTPAASAGPDDLSVADTSIREVSRANADVAKTGERVGVIIALESGSVVTRLKAQGLERLDMDSPAARGDLEVVKSEVARFAATLERQVPDAVITHELTVVVGGVSAVVPASEIGAITKMPGVAAVYEDTLEQLMTEVTPEFIGADDLWADLGGQELAGEGVVVGVLDSGVWPEHPSFSDPDPFGNAYPAPPVAPGSNGVPSGKVTCDFGDVAYNPADDPFTCNNKLIGAYDFADTYKAVVGLLPEEFDSARDDNGHGTHTASTAAGNGGVASSIFGVDRGLVSGIAPRAHVIAYRVCGDEGCYSSDSAAAMEQAILDEVDVVNFSISGGGNPYGDAVSLAFLEAYEAGVLVTPSAGNSGPGADTVAHREPWTLTVGASTSDRHFISTITLVADNDDVLFADGATVTDGIATATDVVVASDFGDGLCNTPFAAGTFSGEIVICQRGDIARVEKSFNVAAGGAGGLILYNPVMQGLSTDNHFIPSVHVENDTGVEILDFMSTHSGVMGTFTPGVATAVPGDVMASFSSRGGPGQTLGISKPDVTAPGVQILAGHTPMPATVEGGLPGELFQAIQGTSMSAPHTAGAAALVKAAHPEWTPGQIRSALMMTALTDGVTKEDGVTPADAFDYGSGRILPAAAAEASLSISDTAANYLALEERLWDANYPSLYIPQMPGIMRVTRSLENVADRGGRWKIWTETPADLTVTTNRSTTWIGPGKTRNLKITVDAKDVPIGEVRHAMLYLEKVKGPNKGEILHFPITIVRSQASVTIDKVCDPVEVEQFHRTTCTVTVQNNGFDDADVAVVDRVPSALKPLHGTEDGADFVGWRKLVWSGTLYGAAPPDVTAAQTTASDTPSGYLPLSGFGIAPIAGVTDETIVNFTVDPFAYAGEMWDTIGIVSNGYAVVGGGVGADVQFANTDLPDAAAPNNVLAPFWTDLNPSAGGALRAGTLTDGVSVWLIFDWEDVPNFGDGELNDFQIWIELGGTENITFVYGDVSDGDGGFLTVGAENSFGNSGGTVYFDGAGVAPLPTNTDDYAVRATSVPSEPGETHVISYQAKGRRIGTYVNYAYMTSDAFAGTSVARFEGAVIPR